MTSLDEQLNKYLTDVHAIEVQALAQMRDAPKLAGDRRLETVFRDHLRETEEHERLVRERATARDGAPSRIKDVAGAVTGKGFVLFAGAQPDTPGKLTAHAFSYEHMELAAYDLLGRVAERAGDRETVELSGFIGGQEQAMATRLASLFDVAAEASLSEQGLGEQPSGEALNEQLVKYLADAHAIEAQAIQLLERGPDIAGDPELARAFEEHLAETREQQRRLSERLAAHDASPSRLKDAALRLGALNWGAFFAAQPDTPAKLAGFAFAFEHLEIAAYELLKRVSARAGDAATVQTAELTLAEERAAARRLRALFDGALESSLQAQRA